MLETKIDVFIIQAINEIDEKHSIFGNFVDKNSMSRTKNSITSVFLVSVGNCKLWYIQNICGYCIKTIDKIKPSKNTENSIPY